MSIPTYISGALFMRAYRLLRSDVVTTLAHYDLIPTSWALLGVISQAHNGIRPNEAADTLSVKAPLVTTMADDLINRGIILRTEHPTDKRAKLLTLTAEGKKFMKKVEQDVKVTLDTLLQGTTPEDLGIFRKVLLTIVDNAVDELKPL